MKLSIAIIFFICIILSNEGIIVKAQEIEVGSKRKGKQVAVKTIPPAPAHEVSKLGIIGYLHTGTTFGFFGGLEDDLIKNSALQERFIVRNWGSAYGGNLGVLIGNRFLVGFSAMGYSYDQNIGATKEREIGEARLRSQIFGGNVGYAIFNRTHYTYDTEIEDWEYKYRWMLYPYLGVGFSSCNLKLSNYSQKDIFFGGESGAKIGTASFKEFTTSIPVIELGLGFRGFKNKKGGLMLGGEVGGFFNLGKGEWKYEGNPIPNAQLSQTSLSGIYFRIIAGGGFLWSKTGETSPEQPQDGYVKPSEAGSQGDVLPSSEGEDQKATKKKKAKRKKKVQEEEQPLPTQP
ncbi:MAG: hypothetical protein RML72_02155 [Bacteroidia bacterium]|nr:hypothetical protein [Bacteroidia bacterium]MDW8157662.1 hypothetical protein [Bacteroidia bacterium]